VQLRRGRLRQAVSDLDAALAMRDRGWQEYVEPTLAGLTMAHVCLGHLARALELEAELRRVVERGGLFGAVPSIAAGLVRACHGDHEQALTDYRTAASLLGPNLANPAVAEWRELAAWSLAALGLASEALERARTFGAPRAVGFALRTMAHLQPPDEALESLTEASARFEECDAGYFLARTRVDLGARWASAPGKRDDGLQLLHEALDFAREHDVPPLARKATRLLRQHGVDVPSAGTSPGDLLTAGERRVVDLAVTGRSNRAIAQELFVTVKAVEWHLSNAYRKLGISSRAQLSAAMSGDPGSSSSSAM
jgi:DNA-binding CsgD family transcriptional regulator